MILHTWPGSPSFFLMYICTLRNIGEPWLHWDTSQIILLHLGPDQKRFDRVTEVTIMLSHGQYVCMGIKVCRCTQLLLLQSKCHCIYRYKKKRYPTSAPFKTFGRELTYTWPLSKGQAYNSSRPSFGWALWLNTFSDSSLHKRWKVWTKTSHVERRNVIEHDLHTFLLFTR